MTPELEPVDPIASSVWAPMKAAPLEGDELSAWFAGRVPRRLLAIPFSGPIERPGGKSVDVDGEHFDERTDIKPDWFEDRPLDWHHGRDPSGVMTGVLLGKASRLGTFDGLLGEPDEDGWWVDLWMKAGEARLALVERLVRRGAQLFGSTYAYPTLIKRGKAGHIDVWPYMVQTLSTSPQNTHSVLRSAKAVLEEFDLADITVNDHALGEMLTALDDLRNLSGDPAKGRLDPAPDLADRAAKAGRELSGANQAELEAWLEALEGISERARGLIGRVRERYVTTPAGDGGQTEE